MHSSEISDIRNEYLHGQLDIEKVLKNPFDQFAQWMKDALEANIAEPTAMTLATADVSGRPSARMVLLKGFDEDGFVFFTNYTSRKGSEMESNPFVALVFYWREMERQVRIEGKVTKVSEEESDEYFHSRPAESRAGAVVSPQSQVIKDRKTLEDKMKDLLSMGEKALLRPKHWGGCRVIPDVIEFWQGRPGRLHDRIRFSRAEKGWIIERLAP